jgi:hypothetical protein
MKLGRQRHAGWFHGAPHAQPSLSATRLSNRNSTLWSSWGMEAAQSKTHKDTADNFLVTV